MGMTVLPAVISAPAQPSSLLPQVAAVLDGMDISENTRVQYRREIRVFLSWLGSDTLHSNVLLEFKKHLKGRSNLATGSKAKYLSVARAFLRELHRLGVLPVDVTANIKGIKVSRAHKRSPISDADIARVFAYLEAPDVDPRARVIIALMFLQGLRRVEVARLRVEDLNREAKTIAVMGKGKDDREMVDLHPRMLEVLANYLDSESLKSGPLFPSRKVAGAGLSSNAIWRIAMRVHQQLGLAERNLHGWRKAFTTRLIQSGMNLLEVQGYTRHSSLQMLQVYYNRLERTKTLPAFYAAFEE